MFNYTSDAPPQIGAIVPLNISKDYISLKKGTIKLGDIYQLKFANIKGKL
jgi:hypothetical protein